jgi:hypothetical protein
MNRHAYGVIGLSALWVASLSAAMLTVPIEWVVGFFAVTTTLSMTALSLEVWRASRELASSESPVRH